MTNGRGKIYSTRHIPLKLPQYFDFLKQKLFPRLFSDTISWYGATWKHIFLFPQSDRSDMRKAKLNKYYLFNIIYIKLNKLINSKIIYIHRQRSFPNLSRNK